MKSYIYECIQDSPIREHIHATQLIKGRKYSVKKYEDNSFIEITGTFNNSFGGFEKRTLIVSVDDAIIKIKPYLTLIK